MLKVVESIVLKVEGTGEMGKDKCSENLPS